MFVHPDLYVPRTRTSYRNAYGRWTTAEINRSRGYSRVDVHWFSSLEAASTVMTEEGRDRVADPIHVWDVVVPTSVAAALWGPGLQTLVDSQDPDVVKHREELIKLMSLPPSKVIYEVLRVFDSQGEDGGSRFIQQNVGDDEEKMTHE